MKNLIIYKIKKIESNLYKTEINFQNLKEISIDLRLYSTKYKNLVKNLLFFENEINNIKSDFIKTKETACRLLQKW